MSPIERSNALHVLGVAAQVAGELQGARGFMTQRIELARELGDLALVGTESSNLSMVERQLGNLERAEQLATESLQLEARRGDEWAIPYTVNGLAAIAVETGAFERAATLLAAAATLQERQGNAWPPDEAPHFERSRAAVTERLDRELLEQAWSAGEHMSFAQAVRYALAPGHASHKRERPADRLTVLEGQPGPRRSRRSDPPSQPMPESS